MSEMRTDVDLGALERARVERPKRRPLVWVVPLVLLLGFGLTLLSTLTDLLSGSVRVTVVRPQAASAGGGGEAGGSALTRSGWIEPDPFPARAAALAEGVVEEVLVLEGEQVEAGQAVARLIAEDAKLARTAAVEALARAVAEVDRVDGEVKYAQLSFDEAIEVTAAEAIARADLDGRVAEAGHREAAARAAEARVRVAEEELALQRFLAEQGAAGPRQVELAQARADVEREERAVKQADAARARAEVEMARARLVKAERDRTLRIEERLRLHDANAALAGAYAVEREARNALAIAELALERTTVRAPCAGIVMERLAVPGARVGGPELDAVCTIFDPQRLRVRIDVEQTEVARLRPGQKARVRAPTRSDRPYDGEVIRTVAFADIAKVTLQVHVRVADPDAALAPQMLVEVEFLEDADPSAGAAAGAGAEGAAMHPGAVWIPARLLVERDGGASVWVVDALSGRASLRAIEVARRDGERALVLRGLNVSEKLIDSGRDAVSEGDRVELAEEGR